MMGQDRQDGYLDGLVYGNRHTTRFSKGKFIMAFLRGASFRTCPLQRAANGLASGFSVRVSADAQVWR
jgi:hypothetical protein